jgi:hypothetical protein
MLSWVAVEADDSISMLLVETLITLVFTDVDAAASGDTSFVGCLPAVESMSRVTNRFIDWLL